MTGTTSFKAMNQVEWSNLQKWFKAAWTQSWVCSSERRINLSGSDKQGYKLPFLIPLL